MFDSSMLRLLALIVVFAILLKLLALSRSKKIAYPYELQPILTSAECKFRTALLECLPDYAVLQCKVRLADFLKVVAKGSEWRSSFNRVSQKHVDFLVTDAVGLPLVAIELDDSTHRRVQRTILSDDFKNKALDAAGLPLIRVPVRRQYDSKLLTQLIDEAIDHEGNQASA